MTKVYDKSGKKVDPITMFDFKITAFNKKTKKMRTVRTGLSKQETIKLMKKLEKENKGTLNEASLTLDTESHLYFIGVAGLKK